MTFKTGELRKLLNGTKLKDALDFLLSQGSITYYRIGTATTTIRVPKGIEILKLLEESNRFQVSVRPYIQNRDPNKE